MYPGMFIVGIETDNGQATYHYDIEPYWDMFPVKELEQVPEWDGHTPQEAIERIGKMQIRPFAELESAIRRCCRNCWANHASDATQCRLCGLKEALEGAGE